MMSDLPLQHVYTRPAAGVNGSGRRLPALIGFQLGAQEKAVILLFMVANDAYLKILNEGTEPLVIETLIGLIKTNLAANEDVLISGFGKFCVKEKKERRGRNPATGEAMMLEARKVVTFKCSGQLRDKINKSQ